MVGSGIKSIAQFTFKSLYETQPLTGQPRLAEVACWAHARRKIYEVHVATASPAAHSLLQKIG